MSMRAPAFALAALLTACSANDDSADDGVTDPDSSSQDLSEATREFRLLHRVGGYDDIEVRSDVDVPDDVVRRTCAMTRDAYGFDGRLLGVERNPVLAPPFVVGLASSAIRGGRNGGGTIDSNDFLASLSYYREPELGLPVYVAGHELTHMTMDRLGADVGHVPVYAFEGIATSVGLWFTRGRGITTGWPFDPYIAELSAVTRADAEANVRTYRKPGSYKGHTAREVGHAEHVGGLFVEWLRAHVHPRTHHAFGAMSMRIGAGETFEQAFAEEIGISLDAAETQYLDFVGATEGDAATRFRGTVFERQ